MKRIIPLLVVALTAVSCLTTETGSDRVTPSKAGTVFVEGGLMYPGEVLPADFRVVAVNKVTGEKLVFDFAYMSRDKKYPNGIGYKIPLTPGTWRIWAESPGKKISFLPDETVLEVKNRPVKNYHLDQMKAGTP